MPLVLADRIGVFEGIIDDLKHGIVPNTFAERGWQAEWKHNRKSFVIKTAAVAVITSAVLGVLFPEKAEVNSKT